MENLLLANVSAIVDAVALAFVIIFALAGLINGFAKTFFKTFGTIIALLLSALLCPLVVDFLQNSFTLIEVVSKGISGTLTKIFGEELMNMSLTDASEQVLKDSGLIGFVVSIVIAVKAEGSIPLGTTLNQVICPTFAYYIVLVLAFIIVFILLKLIFKVFESIIKALYQKLPFIMATDRILGLVLGLLNGIVNLEIVIMVISVIPLGFMQDLYASIQISTVANFIEDINLFRVILSSISTTNVVDAVKSIVNKA